MKKSRANFPSIIKISSYNQAYCGIGENTRRKKIFFHSSFRSMNHSYESNVYNRTQNFVLDYDNMTKHHQTISLYSSKAKGITKIVILH